MIVNSNSAGWDPGAFPGSFQWKRWTRQCLELFQAAGCDSERVWNSRQYLATGGNLQVQFRLDSLDQMRHVEAELKQRWVVRYARWNGDANQCRMECRLKVALSPDLLGDYRDWPANGEVHWVLVCEDQPKTLPMENSAGSDNRCHPHTLVLKGGGVRGLAYVGALEILWQHYTFDRFVGTSAGGIMAVLLAAGFTPTQLREEMLRLDFQQFMDAKWWQIPWNLMVHSGMHPADSLTDWVDHCLAEKLNQTTRVQLADLPFRATLYACRREIDVIAFDSCDNSVAAGHAVRCSMSIPMVFIPQRDEGFRTYDGGMRYNYPLPVLMQELGQQDVLCLYLGAETYRRQRHWWQVFEWLSIWTEAGDQRWLRQYRDQTLVMDTRPIQTLDVRLTEAGKQFLLSCGHAAAWAHVAAGSDEHQRAVRRRDRLRSLVQKQKRWRSRRRWLKGMGGLLILLALRHCVPWMFSMLW